MGRKSNKDAKRKAEAAASAAPPATSTSHSPPVKKRKLSSGMNNFEAEKLFRRITSQLKRYLHVPQPLPRRLKMGTRSLKDKDPSLLTWVCNKCKRINYPRRYVVTDLPVIQCECGEEGDIEFDFSIANVEVNGECPIVNVKDQKERLCTVFSTASNIEATLRMRQILSGEKFEDNKLVIDIDQLLTQYEFMRIQYGINTNPEEKWNYKTIQSLFIGLGLFGALDEDHTVHELGHHVTVNKNFYDICRVLADGHPLTTGIVPGKKFRHLKPGQIYKAPKKEKFTANKKSTGHAILLIGAGRRRKTNYYHFLNSWGQSFCITDNGNGGFGMVRASDITLRPLKFVRYKKWNIMKASHQHIANEMPPASQEHGELECTLTDSRCDESEDMLCALTLERSQINEATGFAMHNADATGEIVEVFAELLTLKEASNPTRVARHVFQIRFYAAIPDAMESFILSCAAVSEEQLLLKS